jgi:hypothetical protein
MREGDVGWGVELAGGDVQKTVDQINVESAV